MPAGEHECTHAVPCEPMDAGAVCACGRTFSTAQQRYFVCRHKESSAHRKWEEAQRCAQGAVAGEGAAAGAGAAAAAPPTAWAAAGAGAAAAAPPAAARCKHTPICAAVAAGFKCACGHTFPKALAPHHVCVHNSSDAHKRKTKPPPPGGGLWAFYKPLSAAGSASASAGGGSASAGGGSASAVAEEGEEVEAMEAEAEAEAESEAEAEAEALDSLPWTRCPLHSSVGASLCWTQTPAATCGTCAPLGAFRPCPWKCRAGWWCRSRPECRAFPLLLLVWQVQRRRRRQQR
jgi:hypothetical protein